ATYWLILRVLFMVSYTAGITHVRTLLWVGSLICLIMMAMALV
ncbi:MAG: putative MAPEG superfamily protein, partial [Woeseiaceae bacterium]